MAGLAGLLLLVGERDTTELSVAASVVTEEDFEAEETVVANLMAETTGDLAFVSFVVTTRCWLC